MDTDLLLTIGILLAVLTLPSLLSAWVDGRVPRVGAILLIAAAGLVVVAVMQRPGGYAFKDIPRVMVSVAGRYIN
ncbi:hypothetical protein [Pseudogemmobacter humi]|uniref:50S ribosomal protein L35 n=1 Tax=Pseudogemmobacter humi TaxID=2483812 RepID=A0A3P5X4Y6_9RHOB|nr:hypothetical protein [Pseudogemmobacter humi]VDC23297.1 hypothetical protein XINFAN_00984 [Pseudogemmobacter humi]